LYAKKGSSWDDTPEWVTDKYTLSSEETDFTGEFSMEFLHTLDERIVVGAIPYSL